MQTLKVVHETGRAAAGPTLRRCVSKNFASVSGAAESRGGVCNEMSASQEGRGQQVFAAGSFPGVFSASLFSLKTSIAKEEVLFNTCFLPVGLPPFQ